MSRVLSLVAAVAIVSASAALADRALVIGATEEARRGLFRSASGVDTAAALRDAGFEVITADARSVKSMRAALSEFLEAAEVEERLVVHLSGAFVNGAGRTWLLEAGSSAGPDLANVDDIGLSVDTVLAIAGRVPGAAVVALGRRDASGKLGNGLSEGLGDELIPQGVAVVQGEAEAVSGFVAGPMLVAGRALPEAVAATKGVTASGFLSDQIPFLPADEERPVATPNAAEVERAIWQATLAQDTDEAYEGYLERYPDGFFAGEAEQAVERIRNEPARNARLVEEEMDLARGDRRKVQRQLTLLGYDPRGVDGVFGPGSRTAIKRFQVKNGFPETGYLDTTQMERLALQVERHRAQQAAEEKRKKLELEKRDREAWSALGSSGDEADLRTYLERYPEGLYAPIAKERLAAFEAEDRAKSKALDESDWERAAGAGTAKAYKAYLEAHPDGAFAGDARERIEALAGAGSEAEKAARATEAAMALSPMTRLMVEQRLDQLRLNPGRVDGTFDDQTRAAIRRYQRQRGLEATGYMSQEVAARMLADLGGFLLPMQ